MKRGVKVQRDCIHSAKKKEKSVDIPNTFAHSVTGSHSSFVVRSVRLPNIGSGFGPGGRGLDLEAFQGFRNHMNTATRRAERETKFAEVVIL